MTRLGHACRARCSGCAVDTSRIEQHQNGVGRTAGETEVRDAGEAITFCGWPVRDCPRDSGQHGVDEIGTQLTDPALLLHPLLGPTPQCPGEACRCGNVEGAGAYVTLLTAAVQDWGQLKLATRQ